MWVFYLISLPLTLGMVTVTLKYFAGPDVPRYVLFTVGYAWFSSLSIVILVPADIWTAIIGHDKGGIAFFWSWSYWSTFVLTWAVVPTIQGYEDAGDFSRMGRLKASIHGNLIFYLSVGAIGLLGLILLVIMHRDWGGNIVGLAMACSNTFGLVTGAFLLGFGLSEIPKSIWRNADWSNRQKFLSHRIAKMALNLDNAHQEFSNAIVIAQATSNQMTKRDPLRSCMDVIDDMLKEMFKEDPSFKPSGGRLGENDMDYDTDEKSMAALRRQLRRAREEYYRYKSEYMTCVMEALELEDSIKNYERRHATGWKYVSSFRPSRAGSFGSFLDIVELIWRCLMRKQMKMLSAVVLGCMSAAILLAEATLLPSGVDLSLFSILIKAVGKQEVLVQVAVLVPLVYMCICTYYSLFKIGMLMFYSLTPRQTSSVSLLMICSMVARYAPPICYNFLNLIRLKGNVKTVFERIMGNIDDAVPFFGKGFNKIYPLVMVIYTLLVASNFFDRVINFFGSWKRFRFQNEADDMDGFDPSGVIILQKERLWLEQGRNVGENVVPLARNFHNVDLDVESGSAFLKTDKHENGIAETKTTTTSRETELKVSNKEGRKYGSNREVITSKYAGIREQVRQSQLGSESAEKTKIAAAKVSLLQAGDSMGEATFSSPRRNSLGLASTWASMKNGFQNFKANMGSKNFMPVRNVPEIKLDRRPSSSESLDDIFQRLKQRPDTDYSGGLGDDENDENMSSR